MKRILCTWEIGGHLGHLRRLADIVPALRRLGFGVAVAASDISAIASVSEWRDLPVFQAPLWSRRPPSTQRRPISSSEILTCFGYADARGLSGLLRAWRSLLESVRPDVVLGDYSPTALAVARGIGIPTAAIGDGFTLPPPQVPMPSYVPRFAGAVSRLQASDQTVVDTFNQAAASMGLRTIDNAAALWRSDETFLCTYAALDHYGDRGAEYIGVAPTGNVGAPGIGESSGTMRVLAYLKRGRELPVLDALVWLGWHGDIYAPALSAEQASHYFRHGLHISREPFSMADRLQACGLVICHSGHGMVAQALLAGKPLLLLPLQVEQRLLSHRVQQLGAGVLPEDASDIDGLCNALQVLADDATYRDSATAFAQTHQASPTLASDIAARCWELAA